MIAMFVVISCIGGRFLALNASRFLFHIHSFSVLTLLVG